MASSSQKEVDDGSDDNLYSVYSSVTHNIEYADLCMKMLIAP